ncbi:hypothetical protein [Spirosoma flavum]|uniref:Uncharacterized protein n=1 Tax=Spirosoma flavum TaxID=2048557 RepID=A0ABW6APY4_9BACT
MVPIASNADIHIQRGHSILFDEGILYDNFLGKRLGVTHLVSLVVGRLRSGAVQEKQQKARFRRGSQAFSVGTNLLN